MVDKTSYIPLSRQVYDILCTRIMMDVYAQGDLLPSQEMIANELGVSMITVRKAFNYLNKKHIIESKRGIGSIVIKKPVVSTRGFSSDNKLKSPILSTKHIEVRSSSEVPEASEKFGIEDSQVIFLTRLRLINNVNISLEYTYLNPLILVGIKWEEEFEENMSLYSFIQDKYHLQVVRAEEKIYPVIPNSEVREHLNLTDESLILYVERLSFVEGSEVPVEYSQYYVLPEYYGKIVFTNSGNYMDFET